MQSFLNVGAEDDDGNKASQSPAKQSPKELDFTSIAGIKNAYASGKITKEKAIELQTALTPTK